MIKYIILAIILNAILVLNFSTGQHVYLEIKAPPVAEAGSTVEVEIELHKSSLTGFARFQQELPYGVTASPVLPADVNFSFEENTLTLIWLSLPREEKIRIQYQLHIHERLKGDLQLGGTFSYIEDNQRMAKDASGMNLAINPSAEIDERLIVDVGESAAIWSVPPPRMDVGREIVAVRQDPVPDNDLGFIVNIFVHKGEKNYFARIEEKIPEGFTAIQMESKGGIFSFSDQKARIIWRNLPMERSFLVSYRLIPHGIAETVPEISGEFSFMQNDITTSRNIVQTDRDLRVLNEQEKQHLVASITEEPVTPARVTPPSVTPAPHTPAAPVRPPEPSRPVETTRPAETARVTPPSVTPAPHNAAAPVRPPEPAGFPVTPGVELSKPLEAEEGVYYRVQLAAGRRPVDPEKYFGKMNIAHEVRSEIHEGWIKYSAGSFYDYRSARDYRVTIWNTTPARDAFVAAYNDGIRITVQEALVIANHQWFR